MSTTFDIPALPAHLVEDAVRRALAEDLGLSGDLTSQATVAADAVATATMSAREGGRIAGLALAAEAFRQVGGVSFDAQVADGDTVARGGIVAVVSGNARALLAAERQGLIWGNDHSGIRGVTQS